MVAETSATVPHGGESSSRVKRKKGDGDDHNRKKQKRGDTGGLEDRVLSGRFTKNDVSKVRVERQEYTNIPLSEEEENFLKSPEARALPKEIDFNKINRCRTGLGLKEYHWFTLDEMLIYRQVVRESEGFDLPFLPYSIERGNMIGAMDLGYKKDAMRMAKYSKLALMHYNKKNCTDFVFEKLVKANEQATCVSTYYITFMAKSTPSTNSTTFATFQARVRELLKHPIIIELCRIKP